MLRTRRRPLLAVLAVTFSFVLVAVESDAAPKMNAGSRGDRTHSTPAPTQTAPSAARPIERTMTQPGAATAARPGNVAPAQPGGFFNRPGLLGGLAGGLLGAGLFGILMGHGFMGGLGGIASMFGLLLQIGIVAGVALLAWRWWQRRSQPAVALAGGPYTRDAAPNTVQQPMGFGGFGGSPAAVSEAPVDLKPQDFDVFERLLGEIQIAYGSEDLGALRALMTPEMLSYFSEELAKNASTGVVNKISDVKLLQGDLSEAWRQGDVEYATLAMRFSRIDQTLDRATNRLMMGTAHAEETTEVWTFRRTDGGAWVLSAIQQTE
jgi:predicted lipid-binding transport protein (Tim44 family)